MRQYSFALYILLCMRSTYSSLVPLTLHPTQQAQSDAFLQVLHQQRQCTADALSICSSYSILRQYDVIRPLLENQNDLLQPGTIYPRPPAVFAIEEQNNELLKAILDIACPRAITHTGCTQIPSRAAVIYQNQNALREILFPTQIPSAVAEGLQNIKSLLGILTSHVGHRATPNILSLDRNLSLFEIALHNADQESLNLLRQYLQESYEHATQAQQYDIIQWLTERGESLNREQPTYDEAINWLTVGAISLLTGTIIAILNNQRDSTSSIEEKVIPTSSFLLIGTGFTILGCIAMRYARFDQQRYAQSQQAIRLYQEVERQLSTP